MFKLLITTIALSNLLLAAPAPFHVDVSGHGKPMLLIPGLASSGEVWNSTVAHYSATYECHVFTLAGFAGQPPQESFSLASVETAISAYIADHKLTRPVIVGHSLGGYLALSLAAHHPDQVDALVIVDSLPALGAAGNPAATAADLHNMAAQMKTGMSAMSEDARLKMSRSSVEAMATSPADVDRIAAWSKATDWNTEVTAMSEMMGTDLRPELNKITAPTLVLGTWVAFAQYGEAAIRQTFDTQYSALNGVEIALAPKSRHFIMYDDAQWMFAHMDAFLAKGQPVR